MDKAGWHEFLVYAFNRPLAFAHIPTGTTTNTRIDQKGFDGRVTSASMAIGADIEIRGATP